MTIGMNTIPAFNLVRVALDLAEEAASVPAGKAARRTPAESATYQRQILKLRRRFLPEELCSDAPFDMLLTLYIGRADGRPFSVSALITEAQLPETTGMRWIERLERLGYIMRTRSPERKSTSCVALTKTASDRLEELLRRI